MQVWVLTNNEYEDARVWGVFTNPEVVLKKYEQYEWVHDRDDSYFTEGRYEDHFNLDPFVLEDTA